MHWHYEHCLYQHISVYRPKIDLELLLAHYKINLKSDR